jgi:hypothetical protein
MGFGNPKLSKKWILGHARPDGNQGRPDGSSFSCPESNSGIFCRAVRTGKSFHPEGVCSDASSGRLDGQLTALFLSFPTTPISSQSDI